MEVMFVFVFVCVLNVNRCFFVASCELLLSVIGTDRSFFFLTLENMSIKLGVKKTRAISRSNRLELYHAELLAARLRIKALPHWVAHL